MVTAEWMSTYRYVWCSELPLEVVLFAWFEKHVHRAAGQFQTPNLSDKCVFHVSSFTSLLGPWQRPTKFTNVSGYPTWAHVYCTSSKCLDQVHLFTYLLLIKLVACAEHLLPVSDLLVMLRCDHCRMLCPHFISAIHTEACYVHRGFHWQQATRQVVAECFNKFHAKNHLTHFVDLTLSVTGLIDLEQHLWWLTKSVLVWLRTSVHIHLSEGQSDDMPVNNDSGTCVPATILNWMPWWLEDITWIGPCRWLESIFFHEHIGVKLVCSNQVHCSSLCNNVECVPGHI